MNYPKLLSIIVICSILLYSAISYSEFGSPAEFGNLTNTTCWIGGDLGELRCLGDMEIGTLNITDADVYGDLMFYGSIYFDDFFDGDCRPAGEVVQYIDEWGTFYCFDVSIYNDSSAIENLTTTLEDYNTSTEIAGAYVPYIGANKNVDLGANNFTVDTNILYVDSTNDSVGIRIDPLYPFHVPWITGDTSLTAYFGSSAAANNQDAVTGRSYSGEGVRGRSTTGQGVVGTSTNSYGLYGTSVNAYALYGVSTNSQGFRGYSYNAHVGEFVINPSTNATTDDMIRYYRSTTSTADHNIGQSHDYYIEHSGGGSHLAGRMSIILTNAIDGSEDSKIVFSTSEDGGALQDKLTITNKGIEVAGNISGTLSAENVSVNIPSNCSTNYAVTGWDGDLSTTYCTQFEEPGDYLENHTPINVSDLSVHLPQSYMDIDEVSLIGGFWIIPELNLRGTATVPSLGSIQDGFFLRGVNVDPGITFSDSTITANAFIRYDRSEDEIEFGVASGGYIFDGNITTSGNITADNVWLPAYISSHTNNTLPVLSSGVWVNVTFDHEADEFKKRITHTPTDGTNTTFTIQDDGIYEITYTLSFEDSSASPGAHVVTRVTKNDVELNGFTIEKDSSKQNADFGLHHSDLIELATDDEIKLSFTSDDTTVSLTSHLTYGIHRNTGHLTIKRVAP